MLAKSNEGVKLQKFVDGTQINEVFRKYVLTY